MKSSYQKLKEKIKVLELKNQRLETDIYYILEEPESIKGLEARLKHTVKIGIDKIIWACQQD